MSVLLGMSWEPFHDRTTSARGHRHPDNPPSGLVVSGSADANKNVFT